MTHRPHATLALTLVALSLAGACTRDRGGAGWTVAVDTVGRTAHVINTPPATDVGPTLVADEELRVGSLEGSGPASFGMIRSIAVLKDGRFAVADALAEEVRLFDGEGTYLRTFGGQGQGPGELMGMQGVFLDHEGMLRVPELENARLSVFDPDAGFVRSVPLQLFSYGFRGPWAAAMDATGRTMVASSGQYGAGRSWNMLRVYDPDMNQLDSIPYHEYTRALDEGDPAPPGRGRHRRILDERRRDAAVGSRPVDAPRRHVAGPDQPPPTRARLDTPHPSGGRGVGGRHGRIRRAVRGPGAGAAQDRLRRMTE